ncbi:MAG: ABC transporter permease [Austwickia sp.]|jgi:NitT/TauT family transport system permease protein|nr:ABC transporter permease [Austwickia sp.]MBK8435335.1 ABC transporter permease [Austwickia sp.]MBK9101116.1 ABC transporter permease [Austwickia sp.]
MRAVHRRDILAPLLFGVLLLVLWWQLTRGGTNIPTYLLPTPGSVVGRLVDMLIDGEIWPYLWVTLGEALGGCVLGSLVALPLAVVIHRSRWASAAFQPFLGATQAIPAIALAPLLVLWIGYGLVAVVTLCALMVFFPILISTVVGLRHVDGDVINAARIDGASSVGMLWHVEAPLALPSVLAGLRNGFTLSVTGAVVGEMVMGGRGLGMVLTVQRDSVDTAGMFASIIILCVVASSVYTLIQTWERRSMIIDSLRTSTS